MIRSRKFERRFATAAVASIVVLLSFASVAQAIDRISVLPGFNGPVNAISEPDSNGTRYLGGDFTSFDAWGTGRGALVGASSGDVNPSFPKVTGGGDSIYATAADGSGGFYIGGYFTCIGPNTSGLCDGADDVPRNRAAHINADGSVDPSWNPNLNGGVQAIAVSGSNVYLGGNFTTVGGATRNRAAAVGTDGTLTGWNPNLDGGVLAIGVSGSNVYLGGYFTIVGGAARNYAAAVGTDGTLTSWNPDLNNRVNAIGVSGSNVYLGGNFTTVGGATRNRAAAVGTDGALTSWNPNLNSDVNAIGVSGSNVYLGGYFTTVGGAARNYAAAVGTDGTLTSWNPNLNNRVTAIGVSGSNVYLGGDFTTVGAATRNGAAAVTTDGAGTLTDWNPNLNNIVRAIGVSGSNVYLGGEFSTVGGTARNYAAAVTTDGAGTLTDWNPNLSDYVFAIGVSGSTVYLGGEFSTVGGTTRNGAAAVGTDGALSSWNPNLNNIVGAIGVYAIGVSGSNVYLGGEFSDVGGTARNYAAAVDATTGSATGWDPNLNNRVTAIGVSGSNVYLGGDFTTVGAATRNGAAAVTTDGAGTLTDWNPNLNSDVRAIGVSGSTVYLGGEFTTVGGTTRNYSAAVGTDGTLLGVWPSLLPPPMLLSVTKSGSGAGTVASSPAGIDCGATCSTSFASGTSVTLTATPASGSSFIGWSGSGCSGTSTCTVVMSEARAVSAEFAVVPPGSFNLLVSKSGTGGGTVTSSPAGIDCGSDCSETLADGSSVTLTATPAAGSSFAGWSGSGCSGTSTCTVVMSEARTVTAQFTKRPSNVFPTPKVKAGARALASSVHVPGPGTITQRVTRSSTVAAVLTVCKTSAKATKAGWVKLTCKLSKATRAALRKRSLRVSVKTTFTPTGGRPASKTQTVTLKSQRPPPYTG